MRFLMLNWRDPKNPASGGAERVSVAYMRALVERGHEVWWFANAFANCLREETLDGIHYVRGGGKGTSILKARKWYRQQPRFDLVIDQHHGLPWYAPWWCGTNCLAYIHEVLGPVWNSFYPWPVSALGRWQEGWTHRRYAKVPFWTVSESTRRDLKANGVELITVIPNGTDLVALPELQPKPLKEPVRLIAVSRLAPNKRIDHAILAVDELKQRGIQTELSIVVTGEEEAKLRHLVNQLGLHDQVLFTGHLSETAKNAVLQSAHMLLHASVREGWGLNVIEANAMGTPAIVYPVAGLVDSTVDQETGLVAKTEQPQALADSIATLLASPATYDKYRRAAWERSKTFHWSHVLKQGCDFLERQADRVGT
jgi:glycosyltransferase involved in cell wall biosynthesis